MVDDGATDERGISPVVGVVLMVAIVVAIGAVSAGMLFGLSEEREPSPDVTLSLEATDRPAQHAIVHDTGDGLVGERVELRGTTDPDALDGTELTAGARQPIYPVEDTVEVVWHGDDGTSYVLWEFEVDPDETVPEPDERCPWVDTESDGGTEDVKMDDLVVACDVETDKVIEVQNGSVVIGDTVSESKEVDADDATFYGDVHVDNNLNIQDGLVTGSVDSNDLVKVDNSSVDGSIEAGDTTEVIAGSSVGDDVVSDGHVKVQNSDVSGSVVSADSVKLDGATVSDDVYVAADLDCTNNSTIDGQDCAAYSPKNPDGY